MIKMKIILLISIAMLLASCSKFPDLGDGYKLDYDGRSSICILDSLNTVKINSHILDYIFDSTYILAVQRPWDSIPNIGTMKFNDAKFAFENSTFKQYWILNKKDESIYSHDSIRRIAKYSNIYGPYSKEEYLKKRDSLNVPKDLLLKLE